MERTTTFGRKLTLGFSLAAAITLLMGMVSVYALTEVVQSKDRVIATGLETLVLAHQLDVRAEEKVSASRGFLLTHDELYLVRYQEAAQRFSVALQTLSGQEQAMRQQLEPIRLANDAHDAELDELLELSKTNALNAQEVETFYLGRVLPRRGALSAATGGLVSELRKRLEAEAASASATAAKSITLVISLAILAALVAAALAWALVRHLNRQIATAVGQVQSSSTELQAAASQQATGSSEQATAMAEITTTINELLATSRQIAGSAHRVMEMAESTADSAQLGDRTVASTQSTITTIRRHMDLVVAHMLDLGKRSQQIGTVLDIVAELAEQTNILAINATIEASGAGESGRRFAVVADEIRKLADRVSGSTKEIRTLIEEVRSAVNTTVMATETSSKAVDAGAVQIGEVTDSFKRISHLVQTTSESAREINLSTKQQASAVEQVNSAITSVAQASREGEASSAQTLQTASQLAALSKTLLRLVRPDALS
jgi:methyl-accepting chemotaxis protein